MVTTFKIKNKVWFINVLDFCFPGHSKSELRRLVKQGAVGLFTSAPDKTVFSFEEGLEDHEDLIYFLQGYTCMSLTLGKRRQFALWRTRYDNNVPE